MIFYFSATGNSKQVAKKLHEEFQGDMVSISDAVRRKNYEYQIQDDEKVFFVMPVYFWGLPSVVKDFLNELSLKGNNIEACGILTYGGSGGAADRMFLKYMEAKNCEVKAVYGIKMPENCILFFKAPNPEAKTMQLRSAEKEINEVIENIRFNFRALNYSGIKERVLTKFAHPFYDKMRKTDKFTVMDNCIGCGLCQMVCPLDMIHMEDGRPIWEKDKCAWCLACINRCPVEAIQYGEKTKNKGRYVNPVIK